MATTAFALRRQCALSHVFKQPTATSFTFAQHLTRTPIRTAFTRPNRKVVTGQILPSELQTQTAGPQYEQSYQSGYGEQGNGQSLQQRLIYGAGIFVGTLLAINLVFNRETREDGGMPMFERKYLNETMMHTGLGIGIIGLAARTLHVNGWSYRLMSANPWLVMGVGLVGSIGTMFACRMTPPENYVAKYGLWTGFNLTQAALLSPMMFYAPGILARAGLYTVGMMGSLAFVGATAKQEKYLYLGGPLLAGVAIVALSGLAPMVIPATAARTLLWSENIWLYGGLAVFGGFTLYDVQKVLHHARLAQNGMFRADAVNESISLELDFINIFIRMTSILAMQQNRRR